MKEGGFSDSDAYPQRSVFLWMDKQQGLVSAGGARGRIPPPRFAQGHPNNGGEAMGLKERSYNVTVHFGHDDFQVHLLSVAVLYEQGIIDYAAYAAEVSRSGRFHLQGFVIWNESAIQDFKDKDKKPSDLLKGSWTKARSITGSRDYCCREGIHYNKEGLVSSYEFGEWVDAGYNINIKFRKQYQYAMMLRRGISVGEIATSDPAGVLLVGLKQLQDLAMYAIRKKSLLPHAPYYYIGREQFELVLATDKLGWEGFQPEEEE